METEIKHPQTLLQAVRFFSDPETCLRFVVAMRWPNGVRCPTCGSDKVAFIESRQLWRCSGDHERQQFSAKIGTVMEESRLGLDKWLPAIWMVVNCKNGISSYELARALGITQKSAWFMAHRIRLAMQSGTFQKMSGDVEVDETFIGGRARFMHASKRREKIRARGPMGKAAVMGLLERHGKKGYSRVHARVVEDVGQETLQGEVCARVEYGSNIYSDAHGGYEGLKYAYEHGVIDHAERYVDGQVHTNSLENFWSLLKRAIKGTYVSVEPFHLFRYLDEQVTRFNNRMLNDGQRFVALVKDIVGKRLTYKQLIGGELSGTT